MRLPLPVCSLFVEICGFEEDEQPNEQLDEHVFPHENKDVAQLAQVAHPNLKKRAIVEKCHFIAG